MTSAGKIFQYMPAIYKHLAAGITSRVKTTHPPWSNTVLVSLAILINRGARNLSRPILPESADGMV